MKHTGASSEGQTTGVEEYSPGSSRGCVNEDLEQASPRLARGQATLLYLDGTRFDFSEAVLACPRPLPVTDSSGRLLGAALVDPIGRALEASFSFDYATPERLELELQDLYAHIKGHFVLRDGRIPASFYSVAQDMVPVSKIIIEAVVLSIMRPADPRIPTIQMLLGPQS